MAKNDTSISILRKIVVDVFILAGLTICVFATALLMPRFTRGFYCNDESLMYPYHSDTVTTIVLRVVGLCLPILAFFICEYAYLHKERNDEHCFRIPIPAWVKGFYCTAVSFGIGVCFVEIATNISKNTIGRPRPHFLDVCHPSIDCSLLEWQNRYIQAIEYTCTGNRTHLFQDMNKSFMSGHSSWAAYTMFYLALYLEKRMVWKATRVLRHTLQFVVVMLSWFTALSRVSDYKHHWSDVLAGYSVGIIFAVIMYNCTDWVQKKKKHAPLPVYDISLAAQNAHQQSLPQSP
ncbi:hypothetical protein K1T71_010107 [Dendrolimus kikuchii]|uniref:Uncharacterized protein n=1 Tax=Dendrolimus kikuchii TaxID=765133 RepID=A0ACC1CR16_9NEOP|nr:hypothetical protein K1T71_010107 [Dendrolimus kikuchii]